MKHIQTFDGFLNENVDSEIARINKSIFDNLDEYDGITGGECHDIALICFTYCMNSGFLQNAKLLWTGNHSWIEGEYNGIDCVLDLVAVNQKHLGDAFKKTSEKQGMYYSNPKTTTDVNFYVNKNLGVNISAEDAEYGTEELSFLDDFIK